MQNRIVLEVNYAAESMPESITAKVLDKEYLDIKAATKELGFAYDNYTRRLVSEGKLRAVKVFEHNYPKWYIERASIKRYAAGSRRRYDKRRYVFRLDQDDEEQVRKLLANAGIEYELELAYKPESK
jgi:hypothetical protein